MHRGLLGVVALASALLGTQLLVSAPEVRAAEATVRAVATADAYVNSAAPRTKYGTATRLLVSASPSTRRSYLRFTVSGVAGTVTGATLTLQSTKAVPTALEVRRTADWTEKSVTWSSAPAPGAVIGTLASVPAGPTTVDVTPAVTGNGTVNLVVTAAPGASGTAELASREVAGQAATLTVRYDATDTTPPAAPTGVSATAGNASVAVSWAANREADLAGYRLYRRVSGGTWPTAPLASPSSTSFTDTAVSNGTSYDYRVAARDTTGNQSAFSTTVTATPLAPSTGCGGASPYADGVLATAGLTAYWRLGDRSSTTACEGRGLSPGSYGGGYTLGQTGAVAGDADTSVRLDGTSGQVTVPSTAALAATTGWSAEAWVAPTSSDASQTVIRKDRQYLLRVVSSTLRARLWWADGTYTEFATPAVVTSGSFQHVAVTYDGATIRVFRNGVQVASRAVVASLPAGTAPVYLGSSGGYDYLGGRLDEVALYARALGAAEIAAHYQAGGTGLGGGPDQLDALGAPHAVGLRWPAVAGATAYRVYRRAADGSWPSQPLASVSGTTYVERSLTDGTAYAYRVTALVDGNETTPSPVSTATPTSSVLLAVGDIADGGAGAEQTATLLDRLDGAVATLGDHAYLDGSASDFADYYGPTWGRHDWRIRPTVGDHEYDTPGALPYYDWFGAAAGPRGLGYYSYDLGSWHVVVLNSSCSEVGGCQAGSAQETWLRNDLAQSTARCTVAMWHRPLVTSSAVHQNDPSYTDFWRALYDDGVELVLNGHDHAYERFAPQDPARRLDIAKGVRQLTVGTGGRVLYGTGTVQPNSEVRITDTLGVLRLDLAADGYSWQFLPQAGKSATDSGTGSCH